MATGFTSSHRRHIRHLHSGHVLPVGISLPSSTPRHPAHQEPEAEDQRQEQDRGQDPFLRLQHPQEQDGAHPADINGNKRVWNKYTALLLGLSSGS